MSTAARVGDLVSLRLIRRDYVAPPFYEEIGQVVRQTDIMSEIITGSGSVMLRTARLEVVQPAHLDHTQGRRQA